MKLNFRIVTSAVVVAATCVLTAAYYFGKRKTSDVNEVMIFCKLQYNVFQYFDKLLSYVEAAEQSINVCMPSIHNAAIQGRLMNILKKRNIKVRIVIDKAGYNLSTHFFIKELIAAGAEFKYNMSRLEHKFCLIDDKVLMTGTLDWGQDRSADKWNYAYITTRPHLVQPVVQNFYLIWSNNSCNIDPKQEFLNCVPSSESISVVTSDIDID